jgi:hypothetical protein
VTLDLDALDPSVAPGGAHHEPGGMTVRQVLDIPSSRWLAPLPVPMWSNIYRSATKAESRLLSPRNWRVNSPQKCSLGSSRSSHQTVACDVLIAGQVTPAR